MSELPLIEPDPDLLDVLSRASDEMLDPLVSYIVDKGAASSLLETAQVYKQHRPRHSRYWKEIGSEIQHFGGNTFANAARGHGVPYATVVRNVASKLKVKVPSGASVEDIESRILVSVLEKAYEKMSDAERRELLGQLGVDNMKVLPSALPVAAIQSAIVVGGFVSYQVAVIVANAVARALLGRGLQFGANAALTRTIGILAGPIGWALTAIWTVVDIAGPAYRVTIPCVIQVAVIRQELMRRENTWTCAAGHDNPKNQRFCGDCGAARRLGEEGAAGKDGTVDALLRIMRNALGDPPRGA